MSDPNSYHFKAFENQEMDIEKSLLIQMVLKLQTQTNTTNMTYSRQHQDTDMPIHKIKPNQIINARKEEYLIYWNEAAGKQSKHQYYLDLNRDYTTATYLSAVKDSKLRTTMSKYRLSAHSLTVETGRYRQNWQPRKSRICPHCAQAEVEMEEHFLTHCTNYQHIRETFYTKLQSIYPQFTELDNKTQLQYLLGEKTDSVLLAAKYINACHKKRKQTNKNISDVLANTHKHTHT